MIRSDRSRSEGKTHASSIRTHQGRNRRTRRDVQASDLRRLFKDLAFTEVVVPKSHVAFLHAGSETEIFLPLYRSNQKVAPRHLVAVRTMLDAKGLLDGDEFDRAIAAAGLEHPASG